MPDKTENVIKIYKITRAYYNRSWASLKISSGLLSSEATKLPYKVVSLSLENTWHCVASYGTLERAAAYVRWTGTQTALGILKVPLKKGDPIVYEMIENAII